jgi:hypothetical protein
MIEFVLLRFPAPSILAALLGLTIFSTAERSAAENQSQIEVKVVSEYFICHHQGRVCSMVIDPSLATEEALIHIARSLDQQNSQYRYFFVAFYTDVSAAQLRSKSHKTDEEADYEHAHMPAAYVKNDWTSHDELFLELPGLSEKVIRLHPEIEPTGGLYYVPSYEKDLGKYLRKEERPTTASLGETGNNQSQR